MTDLDDDGYRIIRPIPTRQEKGIKCGQCGMKFDHGRTYAYWCPRTNCPVQLRTEP
jgi:hypothetical protein